ncbi:sugar transferase [Rhodopila sp.]|uniref:sugar transferase n=1 Tax=Rhodopila sp. TaxID=2480087 RepID=UPI003D0F675B
MSATIQLEIVDVALVADAAVAMDMPFVTDVPIIADVALIPDRERVLPKTMLLRHCYRLVEDACRRDLDVILALFGLVCLLPVILVLACLIATDGGPVFFSHKRVGRHGVMFGCWKFRTMVVGAEECLRDYLKYHPHVVPEWNQENKLAVDPRITPLGAFLRKTSLDEVPQLWNVLLGEMSLVGPRPVTAQEMRERYGSHADVVTSVRPGVTGLWQVSGRNDIDYDLRVLLDHRYVRSRTLLSDLVIMLQTVPAVVRARGAR